jgi:hypothetical protein
VSTELAIDVICKDCGEAGKVVIDLDAFKASCEEQGIPEQQGADALVVALENGKVACPACEARRN